MNIFLTLEAFTATGFNEIFSGRQPHQDVMFSDVSGTGLDCNVKELMEIQLPAEVFSR